MKARKFIAFVSLVSLGACSAASAADGWKLPDLVPFKKSKNSHRATASITDQTKSTSLPKMSMPELPKVSMPKMKIPEMSMPSWLHGTGKPASKAGKRSSKPSTFDKINRSTQNFFGKTKEVLMPWTVPKKHSTKSARGKNAKKNSFLGMSFPWTTQAKPPKVKSVQDFMALDRPSL